MEEAKQLAKEFETRVIYQNMVKRKIISHFRVFLKIIPFFRVNCKSISYFGVLLGDVEGREIF